MYDRTSKIEVCGIRDVETARKCLRPTIADAPWAICQRHARLITIRYSQDLFDLAHAAFQPRSITPEQRVMEELEREVRAERSVVYYLDLGSAIKIGTSVSLKARLKSLRLKPDVVMATEPGDVELERERHREFAHLRIDRAENFRPEVDLLLHVKRVREENGPPQITEFETNGTMKEEIRSRYRQRTGIASR